MELAQPTETTQDYISFIIIENFQTNYKITEELRCHTRKYVLTTQRLNND